VVLDQRDRDIASSQSSPDAGGSSMTRKIIKLGNHPANEDKTAKLEWSGPNNKAVYGVRGGFVCILAYGLAFEGLFETLAEAKLAANEWVPA
jgi:hypothetical protein